MVAPSNKDFRYTTAFLAKSCWELQCTGRAGAADGCNLGRSRLDMHKIRCFSRASPSFLLFSSLYLRRLLALSNPSFKPLAYVSALFRSNRLVYSQCLRSRRHESVRDRHTLQSHCWYPHEWLSRQFVRFGLAADILARIGPLQHSRTIRLLSNGITDTIYFIFIFTLILVCGWHALIELQNPSSFIVRLLLSCPRSTSSAMLRISIILILWEATST